MTRNAIYLKWQCGRAPKETEEAWNRRNALALLPPESSRHCCVCLGVCFHPGTRAYCAEHRPCSCGSGKCPSCMGRLR